LQGNLADEVQPGDVVVIRYEGPKGGPGTGNASPTSYIMGQGLKVALITDGRFPGEPGSLYRSHFTRSSCGGVHCFVKPEISFVDIPQMLRIVSLKLLAERRHLWQIASQTPTIF